MYHRLLFCSLRAPRCSAVPSTLHCIVPHCTILHSIVGNFPARYVTPCHVISCHVPALHWVQLYQQMPPHLFAVNCRQLRNLEKELGDGVRVGDRTALILDIFSQRAATKEATLQVM